MNKILRGKYLVRRAKLEDGTKVLLISGVFIPQNFNVDDIDPNDEMWVSDIIVSSGIRYTDLKNDECSPEEFMQGSNSSPKDWKVKRLLR